MESFQSVRPCKPVAPYIGGKRNLADHLCRIIQATPHKSYVECFMGMGGVFLRRTARPEAEVINDASGDVANLFRILQRHYQSFMEELKWRLSSRQEFERLMAVKPDTLTDMERAARFLYLQRLAFGGKVTGRNFGVSAGRPARFDLTKLASMLEDVHERLAGVTIECLDYKDLISRYDRPDVLFYLDPPYYGSEDDYGPDVFSRAEFDRMADQLAGIDGHFILSLNNCPDVQSIFSNFKICTVETTYSISQHEKQKVSEVIISNYDGPLLYEQKVLL